MADGARRQKKEIKSPDIWRSRLVKFHWSRSIRNVAAILCAVLLLTGPSFAFCWEPDPSPEAEFLNSDAVFVGTVISKKTFTYGSGRNEGIAGWEYTLRVQERFRGPQTSTVSVFTDNDSSRLPLEVGGQYLLFAITVQDKDFGPLNRLEISNCGNSDWASNAKQKISQLRPLTIPKEALIEANAGTTTKGLRIVVSGGGKRYTATSDQDGVFHLHVPPGKYEAYIEDTEHLTFSKGDQSQDDPSSFLAEEGRSIGLQFAAIKK